MLVYPFLFVFVFCYLFVIIVCYTGADDTVKDPVGNLLHWVDFFQQKIYFEKLIWFF